MIRLYLYVPNTTSEHVNQCVMPHANLENGFALMIPRPIHYPQKESIPRGFSTYKNKPKYGEHALPTREGADVQSVGSSGK